MKYCEHSQRNYVTAHTVVTYYKETGSDTATKVYLNFSAYEQPKVIKVGVGALAKINKINGVTLKDSILVPAASTSSEGGFKLNFKELGVGSAFGSIEIETLSANTVVSVFAC